MCLIWILRLNIKHTRATIHNKPNIIPVPTLGFTSSTMKEINRSNTTRPPTGTEPYLYNEKPLIDIFCKSTTAPTIIKIIPSMNLPNSSC